MKRPKRTASIQITARLPAHHATELTGMATAADWPQSRVLANALSAYAQLLIVPRGETPPGHAQMHDEYWNAVALAHTKRRHTRELAELRPHKKNKTPLDNAIQLPIKRPSSGQRAPLTTRGKSQSR